MAGDDFFDYVTEKASGPISSILGAAGSAFDFDQDSFGPGLFDAGSTGGYGPGLFDFDSSGYASAPFDDQDIFGHGVVSGGFDDPSWRPPNPGLAMLEQMARPQTPGITTQIGVPSTRSTRIAQTITREASRLGLDPDFALWVAENEGGLDDAAANRRNAKGSHAYGPYQLLIGGGLGDEALEIGIDPRDAGSWERQIKFALEHVARNGWGRWEAVTARGIDPWTGVGGRANIAAPGGTPGRLLPGMAPVAPGAGLPGGPPVGAIARPAAMPGAQPPVAAAPGTGTGSYAQFSTTPNVAYSIAFDFDQPYGGSQFNTNIPNHRGIDLVVKGAASGGRGSRVGAFHSGRVAAITRDPNGGNGVIILGDDGLYHRYFHFDSIIATERQRIERGTPIGILGASGTEGFPHLHYEVSRRVNGDPQGQMIDPRPYLRSAN